MTDIKESTSRAGGASGPDAPRRQLPPGWSSELDVQFLAVAGEVHKVPGSTTSAGRQGIAAAVRSSLDKVRQSVRSRSDKDDNAD
jgi:hypothetical protein